MKQNNSYIKFTRFSLVIIMLQLPYYLAAQITFPNTPLQSGLPAKDSQSKMSGDLIKLQQEYQLYRSQRTTSQKPFKPESRLFQIRPDGYIAIEATAELNGEALKKELIAFGAQKVVAYGRMVSSFVPISRIAELNTISNLRFVRPAYKPEMNVGFTTSQGDQAQKSDVVRSRLGLAGKNITVGVISDSYNVLIGEKIGILSGDLPGAGNPLGNTTPVRVLEESKLGGTDEGRAMLEIIHDVVPEAKLAFHTVYGGQAAFAQGILKLKAAGCDVIVDDVKYLEEPYYQEGIIAQAVNQVTKEGAIYFSSAGNQSRGSYEKAFQPSKKGYINGEAHSFASGDEFLRVFIPKGQEAIFALQWSDPYFTVSGKGAETDLDIYLLNDAGNRVLTGSNFPNIQEDPYEIIGFTNNGPSEYFNILIEKSGGPNPERMKLIGYGVFSFVEHQTNSSTVTGHANSQGAIAVGAARYNRTPEFGVTPPVIEYFSSAGGTPILFDEYGNKISPIVYKKPEIVAPNGGNTTFFIPGVDSEKDGFPNFFGTSASAPHAAAVAAMMQQAAPKHLKADQVRKALQETAIDMDDPGTINFDTGFDFLTGYGFIQADKAVERIRNMPLVSKFILVNADNGKDLGEIKEGDVINTASLPTRNLNIRAVTFPEKIGSVLFTLNDAKATENILPYALAGDINTNPIKYRNLNPALKSGEYALTATPYTGSNGTGKTGVALQVNFKVVESAVTRFVVVDADKGEDLFKLEDGALINLTNLPKHLNIRADAIPAKVGSIVFEYNGYLNPEKKIKVIENLAPYVLGGDFKVNPFEYRALPESLLENGIYALTATPYSKAQGQGVSGKPLVVFFLIYREEASNMARAKVPNQVNNNLVLAENKTNLVFPNPTSGLMYIQSNSGANISLYDAKGSLVSSLKASATLTTMDVTNNPAGLYLIRVNDGQQSRTYRVIKK